MLTILFKILSILGILLLILLGIALVIILLVLFFPVCYKVSGKKTAEEMLFDAKMKWLFGLVRVTYSYPVPGKLLAKVLFFTVYDSSEKEKKSAPGEDTHTAPKKDLTEEAQETSRTSEASDASEPLDASEASDTSESSDTSGTSGQTLLSDDTDIAKTDTATDTEASANAKTSVEENTPGPQQETSRKLAGFFEKIRYTIRKICDKIKYILKNISFYKELWNDPDTKGLLQHAGKRIGHILKRLRPRKLNVNARIGTGSPDTTGYLYGIYGMILPKLGKGVCITPDFEQAILEGDLKASGHFTVACVLFHSARLLMDKRLQQLKLKIRTFQKNQKK